MCCSMFYVLDFALSQFDPHVLSISRNPLQWTRCDVEKYLNWLVVHINCSKNDIGVLCIYTGEQLVHMRFDQMCNNAEQNANNFGHKLWHTLEILLFKLQRSTRPQLMNTTTTTESSHTFATSYRRIPIWQYLMQLLVDGNYRNVITWTSPTGWRFRIKDTDELARLWGEVIGRSDIDYQAVISNIRYYYTCKIDPILFKPSPRQHCIFQFNNNILDIIKRKTSQAWRSTFLEKYRNMKR